MNSNISEPSELVRNTPKHLVPPVGTRIRCCKYPGLESERGTVTSTVRYAAGLGDIVDVQWDSEPNGRVSRMPVVFIEPAPGE